MKKSFFGLIALVGVAFAAAPAMAQVDVTVGGHTKNYVGFLSQDTDTNEDERNFDMLRESEMHFNAEGTADNGLTYGFHVEAEADSGDGFEVEESYLYLASNLGRVNLGSEDGAAYLLQVAAPSADENIDGVRQHIRADNIDVSDLDTFDYETYIEEDGLDYDHSSTGSFEKITYLSPNWNGFQFGLSYTPDVDQDSLSALSGFAPDDETSRRGDAYEAAVRYEGNFNNIGFALGGGYSKVNIEVDNASRSDNTQWNAGADFDIGAFGVGAAYTAEEEFRGFETLDLQTYVVGADYTTGPFKFGASYLNQDGDVLAGSGDIEVERYTGGVVYTLTQGLTLRGSISHVDYDTEVDADTDATSVLGGIQFNF